MIKWDVVPVRRKGAQKRVLCEGCGRVERENTVAKQKYTPGFSRARGAY
jgi:hypothetical protein